ncbi:MAG: hypothetical protein ACRDPY_40530 [Streptosporangiaceae bacterium]
MTPIYMTRDLANGRHRELLQEAGRRRLLAALPQEPGVLQRFALRAAGWDRRPAVVAGRPAVVPSAYEPSTV